MSRLLEYMTDVAPRGSFERIQDELRQAAKDYFISKGILKPSSPNIGSGGYCSVQATFPKTALIRVEDYSSSNCITYEVAYKVDKSGGVSITGEPKKVKVEPVVTDVGVQEARKLLEVGVRVGRKDRSPLFNIVEHGLRRLNSEEREELLLESRLPGEHGLSRATYPSRMRQEDSRAASSLRLKENGMRSVRSHFRNILAAMESEIEEDVRTGWAGPDPSAESTDDKTGVRDTWTRPYNRSTARAGAGRRLTSINPPGALPILPAAPIGDKGVTGSVRHSVGNQLEARLAAIRKTLMGEAVSPSREGGAYGERGETDDRYVEDHTADPMMRKRQRTFRNSAVASRLGQYLDQFEAEIEEAFPGSPPDDARFKSGGFGTPPGTVSDDARQGGTRLQALVPSDGGARKGGGKFVLPTSGKDARADGGMGLVTPPPTSDAARRGGSPFVPGPSGDGSARK